MNGYICGADPILYTHNRPCWSVSSDIQGEKEIAATTAIVTAVYK